MKVLLIQNIANAYVETVKNGEQFIAFAEGPGMKIRLDPIKPWYTLDAKWVNVCFVNNCKLSSRSVDNLVKRHEKEID